MRHTVPSAQSESAVQPTQRCVVGSQRVTPPEAQSASLVQPVMQVFEAESQSWPGGHMSCDGVHCAQLPVDVSHTGPIGDAAQSEFCVQREGPGLSASVGVVSSVGVEASLGSVASGPPISVPGVPSAQPNARATSASAAKREAAERRWLIRNVMAQAPLA